MWPSAAGFCHPPSSRFTHVAAWVRRSFTSAPGDAAARGRSQAWTVKPDTGPQPRGQALQVSRLHKQGDFLASLVWSRGSSGAAEPGTHHGICAASLKQLWGRRGGGRAGGGQRLCPSQWGLQVTQDTGRVGTCAVAARAPGVSACGGRVTRVQEAPAKPRRQDHVSAPPTPRQPQGTLASHQGRKGLVRPPLGSRGCPGLAPRRPEPRGPLSPLPQVCSAPPAALLVPTTQCPTPATPTDWAPKVPRPQGHPLGTASPRNGPKGWGRLSGPGRSPRPPDQLCPPVHVTIVRGPRDQDEHRTALARGLLNSVPTKAAATARAGPPSFPGPGQLG